MNSYVVLLVILAVVGLLALALLSRAKSREAGSRAPASSGSLKLPPNLPNAAFGKLVGACMGDRQKAERLVQYEQKKLPSLSRDQAIGRAIERINADRGRYG